MKYKRDVYKNMDKKMIREWIDFDELKIPQCGEYYVKVKGKERKSKVSVIHTYIGDDRSRVLHGFYVSTLSISEQDQRERYDWVGEKDYRKIKNVTHYSSI